MTDHTEGRLEYAHAGYSNAAGKFVVDEYFVRRVGDSAALATDIIDPSNCGHPPSEANARRLAACWNACMGISTDSLERYYNTGAGLDEALQEESLRGQVLLYQQRDRLLAALEHLVAVTTPDVNGQLGAQEEHDAALANAKELITAVKGGAAWPRPSQ